MSIFGFRSSSEVEEEKRRAAEEAVRNVVRNNLTNLSNLSKGSQINFAIPYFDVFDPRFTDYGVPVAVHGCIVYSIDDMNLFHQVNKNEAYSDETFQTKLRSSIAKYVKSVVSNAPTDAQIPVVHRAAESDSTGGASLCHQYPSARHYINKHRQGQSWIP